MNPAQGEGITMDFLFQKPFAADALLIGGSICAVVIAVGLLFFIGAVLDYRQHFGYEATLQRQQRVLLHAYSLGLAATPSGEGGAPPHGDALRSTRASGATPPQPNGCREASPPPTHPPADPPFRDLQEQAEVQGNHDLWASEAVEVNLRG